MDGPGHLTMHWYIYIYRAKTNCRVKSTDCVELQSLFNGSILYIIQEWWSKIVNYTKVIVILKFEIVFLAGKCESGFFSTDGSGLSPCQACGEDRYSDSLGSSSCTLCQTGYKTFTTTATSNAQCIGMLMLVLHRITQIKTLSPKLSQFSEEWTLQQNWRFI